MLCGIAWARPGLHTSGPKIEYEHMPVPAKATSKNLEAKIGGGDRGRAPLPRAPECGHRRARTPMHSAPHAASDV